jgi:hypothetical protein
MKSPFRRRSRAAQRPVQLQFEFMRTMPLQLSPRAERKVYDEYLRSVRDKPNHRSPNHRRDDNGDR